MRFKIQKTVLVTVLGLALTYGNIMAASSPSTSNRRPPVAPSFKAGQQAVKAGDFQSAVRYLSKALEKNPKDADTHNLLGFSYRKLGNTDKAFEHYQIALKIDPQHRGANEYLGELYLETDQLAKAEQRLEVLDKACILGCEEYEDLKEAIDNYKAEKK
jgi:Flp pilus assembly protein TadD